MSASGLKPFAKKIKSLMVSFSFNSYVASLLTPPYIPFSWIAEFTNMVSPDLSLAPNDDLPYIKISYKSIVSINLSFLIKLIFLKDPNSEGPPATASPWKIFEFPFNV